VNQIPRFEVLEFEQSTMAEHGAAIIVTQDDPENAMANNWSI
jgi:hypothetical protein